MIKLTILVIVIVFGIIGKVGHALFFSEAAIKRKLKRNRSIRVIDIENEKKIQVEGKIIANNPILTPISNTSCVWFKLEIFSLNRGWELIADEREMLNFLLEDHTGTVEIIAKNMEVAVGDSLYEQEKISEDQMKSVMDFLSKKNAITTELLVSNARLKFREKWLPAEAEVTINGKGYVTNGKKTIKSDLIKPLYINVLEEKLSTKDK